MLHRTFQQLVRDARRERGLSQADVAAALGIKQPSYAAIESGDNEPTLGTVEKVAEALDLDVEINLREKIPA